MLLDVQTKEKGVDNDSGLAILQQSDTDGYVNTLAFNTSRSDLLLALFRHLTRCLVPLTRMRQPGRVACYHGSSRSVSYFSCTR